MRPHWYLLGDHLRRSGHQVSSKTKALESHWFELQPGFYPVRGIAQNHNSGAVALEHAAYPESVLCEGDIDLSAPAEEHLGRPAAVLRQTCTRWGRNEHVGSSLWSPER